MAGPVAPLAKLQLSLELTSFFLCLITIIGQLGLLDYYFVDYLNDKLWLLWIIADVAVLAVMVWLLVIAIKYNRRCMKERCTDDANVKFAFVAWFVYSIVLSAKIAVILRTFADQIKGEKLFGPTAFKIILALSAIIFLFLVLSHHYTQLNSPRQMYLSYLASSVTLDVIDSVLFLQLLIDPDQGKETVDNNFALQISILVLACFNFILPTFALFKLRYSRGLPRWVPLPYEKLYTLFYFLTVNVPYLVIRAYVWKKDRNDVSIFIVKNVIMVILAFREVWVSFLAWKQSRAAQRADGQESSTCSVGVGGEQKSCPI